MGNRSALAKNTSLQSNILSRITDIIIVLNDKNQIIFANKSARQLLNLKNKEIIGQKFNVIFNKYCQVDREIKKAISTTLSKEDLWQGIVSFIKTNNKKNHLDSTVKILKNKKNQRIGCLIFAHDITKHIKAKEMIKTDETKFRRLIESNIIGVVLVDDKGRIIEINDAFLKIIGYTRKDFIDGKVKGEKINPPEYWDIDKQALRELEKYGVCPPFEKELIRKDGSRTPVLVGATVLDMKKVNKLFFIFDITCLKKSQEKLRFQKTLLELLSETATEGIIVFSPTGQPLYFNENFIEMWQMEEKIMTQSDEKIFEAMAKKVVHKKEFIDYMNDLKFQHKEKHQEIELKSGQTLDCYSDLVKGKDNVCYGRVYFFFDITSHKKETSLRDDFLGITSHELKTPLTSIKAFAQLLLKRREKFMDQKSAFYLSKIDTQVNTLTRLINDLLDVTRVRTGKLEYSDEVFYLDDLIKETIDMIQQTTQKHQIILKSKVDKFVVADRERIGQVLRNLLSNAVKYSKRGKIIVDLDLSDKGDIIISVKDFGIGIPKKDLSKIFQLFFQANNRKIKKQSDTGLGVGLHIAAKIVEHHEGKIWVKSTVGKGSTFFFTIPAKRIKIAV